MTPENTHAAVVTMLQQQGLPLTTANLNRGMLALAQNDMQTENATLPAVNRSIDRTMGATPRKEQTLPTPPIPPEQIGAAAVTTPQQSANAPQPNAPVNLYDADTAAIPPDMLNTAGVPNANVYDAASAQKPVTIPREPGYIVSGINAAAKYAQDTLTPTPSTAPPFTYNTMMEDIRAGRVPNPNPDLPLILFGTGPVPRAGNAYPAMQQYLRQRTMDIMRQNPQRPPSNMLNQAGDGYEEALAARARTSQRPAYKGEGVDDFIQGGNNTQPTPSVKQNTTPTWKGEGDPSAPMGAPTAANTPALSQTLTKRKQMASSKSTRKSKD